MEDSSSYNNEWEVEKIEFENERYYCRKRAVVGISESENNPNRLYFSSLKEQGKYGYYRF